MTTEKTSATYSTNHMCVDIQGFLRNYKRKKMDRLIKDDNGQYLSDAEARVFLSDCLAKGWEVLPTADCEGFDYFGGGCPGHPITEEEYNRRINKKPAD